MNELEREVRGARDLVELWRALPVGVLRYPMDALPGGLGTAAIGDELRARAWRERCAAAGERACADIPRACEQTRSGRCRADALFPAYPGGGAPSHRMATLFVHWRPHARALEIVALGQVARDELRWAAARLAAAFALQNPEHAQAECLANVELKGSRRWRIEIATPWVIGKAAAVGRPRGSDSVPTREEVEHELRKSLVARAHKLATLVLREPLVQRLGGHLAHYAGEALLARELSAREVHVAPVRLKAAQLGHEKTYDALAWTGAAVVEAGQSALPWLTYLVLCGGGENADKGFGSVELTPLDGG